MVRAIVTDPFVSGYFAIKEVAAPQASLGKRSFKYRPSLLIGVKL
ncbi:hypothetical protein PPE_05970 [Paenibacillus polymyxa E681]|nr:hypothetical protein PPE_05970 [Paenibacillus polymyxa E681]